MVICVLNQKGGVGKTTTAINVAVGLAQWGQDTLLIDIDPQGNATSGLGIRTHPSPTLYETLVAQDASNHALPATQSSAREQNKDSVAPRIPYIHQGPVERLHVIGASTDLAGAEIELASNQRRDNLSHVLKQLQTQFPVIILDTPPSLSILTVNALVASNHLIIPIQCEYFALEGLGHLWRTLELVKKSLNPDLSILGLVRTMYDARLGLSAQVSQELETHFPQLLFKSVIPRNVRLAEAPSHGLPIAMYDKRSPGADAYRRLALEVLQKAGMAPQQGHLLKKR